MVARNQVLPQDPESDEEDAAESGEEGMKDDEIIAVLQNEISSAAGSATTSLLQENRRSALKYYMGDPYGDEQAGRSSVVTSDLRDTVESLLPQLMKIFSSSDTIVQFTPSTPQDEEGAQQASDRVNHLFMVENDGFLILYTMIKDALLFKNGVVKVFWDETIVVTKETYEGLTEEERNAVLTDPEVEPVAYSEYEMPIGHNPYAPGPGQQPQMGPQGPMPPPPPPKLCDLTIRRTKKKGKGKVVCLPPEEFLITQRSDGIKGSRFCAHRCRKT